MRAYKPYEWKYKRSKLHRVKSRESIIKLHKNYRTRASPNYEEIEGPEEFKQRVQSTENLFCIGMSEVFSNRTPVMEDWYKSYWHVDNPI